MAKIQHDKDQTKRIARARNFLHGYFNTRNPEHWEIDKALSDDLATLYGVTPKDHAALLRTGSTKPRGKKAASVVSGTKAKETNYWAWGAGALGVLWLLSRIEK